MSRCWLYWTLPIILALPIRAVPVHRASRLAFRATAFSTFGITRSGTLPHFGVVAADNTVLPLGTRIRVTEAGSYSGTYVVRDTGALVHGRHIDIYIPNTAAAKEFGRKVVRVTVLHWGDGKPVAGPAAGAAVLAPELLHRG